MEKQNSNLLKIKRGRGRVNMDKRKVENLKKIDAIEEEIVSVVLKELIKMVSEEMITGVENLLVIKESKKEIKDTISNNDEVEKEGVKMINVEKLKQKMIEMENIIPAGEEALEDDFNYYDEDEELFIDFSQIEEKKKEK